MRGNIRDMTVADLIQHNCLDRKTASLEIQAGNEKAILFFQDGKVPHATLGDLEGEDVVYHILNWESGQFHLVAGVEPPKETIQRSYSSLILEGARRLDEKTISQTSHKEKKIMATKKKSELLDEVLTELLEESSDIEGVAVASWDGLLYSANVPNRDLDENLVGAVAAATLGLSKRNVEQLQRGNFTQTLVQGEDGNIIVADLENSALFIGLTPAKVNLGMAFAEVRSMVGKLNAIL